MTDLPSHLDPTAAPSPASRLGAFSSFGTRPLMAPPPSRRVMIKIPSLAAMFPAYAEFEAEITDIIEPADTSADDAQEEGRAWGSAKGASAMFNAEAPNRDDPLFLCSGIVRDCPYPRLSNGDLFKIFCRGAINALMMDGRQLALFKQSADPCPHHSHDSAHPYVVEGRKAHADALAALDFSKPLVEQLAHLKIVAPRHVGEMPDALWERALSGRPVSDTPEFDAHDLFEIKCRTHDATRDDPTDDVARVPVMRLVDGKEVPYGKPIYRPSYTDEERAEAVRKLAEVEAAIAERDRLHFSYFRCWHWTRGVYGGAQTIIANAEQVQRQAAAKAAEDVPPPAP